MRVLAIDSATSACSAAYYRDGIVRSRRFEIMERGHAESLMPMVIEVMAEADADFVDIDLVAVTVGPGSFTGLRVGLAAARGLSLARGVPLMGVTTLEAVAHGLEPDRRMGRDILVALETKRADLYVQTFAEDMTALIEPRTILPESIAPHVSTGPIIIVGDGAERLRALVASTGRDAVFAPGPGLPDAAVIAGLAETRWVNAKGSNGYDNRPLNPLYLRSPYVGPPTDGAGTGK